MNKIFVIIESILVLLAILNLNSLEEKTIIDDCYLEYSLLLALCGTIIFLNRKNTILKKKNYYKPSFFFILGYGIVFFQMSIDYYISPEYRSYYLNFFISNYYLNYAVAYATICLLSIYIGFILEEDRRNKSIRFIFSHVHPKELISRKVLLIILLILFFVFCFSIDSAYFHGGYGVYMNEYGLPILFYLSQQYFMYIAVIYIIQESSLNVNISIFQYVKNFNYLFYLIIFLWSILVFMSGDRGPVIQIILVYISAYIFANSKIISLSRIIALIFLAGLSITFLGILRELDQDSPLSQRVIEVVQSKDSGSINYSFSPYTSELARSVRTFCVALYMNANDFFTYGLITLFNLVTIIPGVGIILGHFGIVKPDYFNNATSFFGADHSLGTSFLDCFIYDFGIYLTPIILILWGRMLYLLDCMACYWSKLSTTQKCFLIAFVWKAIYLSRSDYYIVFRDAVVFIILYKILLHFFSVKTKFVR